MNVLLSSVGRKVSLARTWRKACLQYDAKLVVADMNLGCAGMYEGDLTLKLPALDGEAFRPILMDACLKHGVTLVIPTRDAEVLAFAEWREEFAREGIRLLAPAPETVRLVQDKIRFAGWCELGGFNVAKVYSDAVQFPAFVRARHGMGSRSCRRVVNVDDLWQAYALYGRNDCIVQEYVRSAEYSVDVFSDKAGNVISAVPRQRVETVGGESWVSVTVDQPRLREEAEKLSLLLGLTGHSVLQAFIRDGEVLWIEVNPRFGGASALAFEAGCNSAEWLMMEQRGIPLPKAPAYGVGLSMLRYTQDRFVRSA